ncbi:sensor histidine kinase [Saccharothrix deserti]|uniref:sensor histidine kinase n=1 Tax=Saccharothrix deserti TaxID=2593674 RepID=UPI001EE49A56|nr:histidine kinase [Saccharothrix deserti]
MRNSGRTWSRKPPAPPWALTSLAALLAVVALAHGELGGWALAGALSAPVVAVVLLARCPLVSLGVCAATAVATALAVHDSVPPWSAALGVALCVIGFLAGRGTPGSASVVPVFAVFAVGAVLAVLLVLVEEGSGGTGLLLLVLVVVLPWFLGRSVRQQTELAAAAAERVHLRERARIAHDMHDTLGHELSLLALRAGALEIAPDIDVRHRAVVAQLRAAAGTATDRLADIVAVLRDGEPAPLHPVSEHVEDLVERAAHAGMAVSLEWSGPRPLPPAVDRAAHGVVQEALTNAVKHAAGSAVRVKVVNAEAETAVTVTNTLPPRPLRGAGGRVGLAALRERVRSFGGTLDINRDDHTFEVVAVLPHEGKP